MDRYCVFAKQTSYAIHKFAAGLFISNFIKYCDRFFRLFVFEV